MTAPDSRTTDPVIEHCRDVLARGSRSFARAATLLDPKIRAGAFQLYAWCRHCDDVIDLQTLGHGQRRDDPARQAKRLADLRATTERALRGEPVAGLVFQAIARVVHQHGVPARLPFEFLDGMEMDVQGRRYRTWDELRPYCYAVAGVVAVMMARIIGITDQPTLDRAEDLGVAMQTTNIARDVMDDARIGRVYLPLDWLDAAMIPPDQLADPAWRSRLVPVVTRLLDQGDELYRRADRGLDAVPFRSAWSIAAARWIYSEIGEVVRARGERAWDSRAVVGSGRKAVLVMKALGATLRRHR